MAAIGHRGHPDVSTGVEPLTSSATLAASQSSASPGPSSQRQERGKRSVVEPTERGRQPSRSRRVISSSLSPDLTTSSKRHQDEDDEDCDIEELSRNSRDEAVVNLCWYRLGRGRGSIRWAPQDKESGTCLQCVKFHFLPHLIVNVLAEGAMQQMSEAPMGMWICRGWRNSVLVLYTGKDILHHQTGNCDNACCERPYVLAARQEGKQEDEEDLICKAWQRVEQTLTGQVGHPSRAVLIRKVAIHIALPFCIPFWFPILITLPFPAQPKVASLHKPTPPPTSSSPDTMAAMTAHPVSRRDTKEKPTRQGHAQKRSNFGHRW